MRESLRVSSYSLVGNGVGTAYTEAKVAMFFYSDTADAPWTIVKSDDKKRAQLNRMQHFLSSLPYAQKNHKVARAPAPLIVGSSNDVIGRRPCSEGVTSAKCQERTHHSFFEALSSDNTRRSTW